MMLRDNLHGEMMLQNLDVGVVAHCFHQATLNFGTRVVGMVQDAELRVTALAMQVKRTVLLLVEIDTPF